MRDARRFRQPPLYAVRKYSARLALFGVGAILFGAGGAARSATAPSAGPGVCREMDAGRISQLDRIYRRGEFRIIYTVQGAHALASTVDRNGNGIPDRVEDVATQLVAARRIYSGVIGLDHPLDMPRYARVRSIDVFLLDMKEGNGLAYDEAVNYRLAFDGPEGRCTLRIDVGIDLANQNPTPAHELFHLYQYAYSMFKARWFLEGTARWAEHALRAGAARESPLPATGPALQDRFFSQTYRAASLWNRLARISDPVGRITLPDDLVNAVYLDGGVVVHDNLLHGAGFMKALLEEMGEQSAHVASLRGWNRFNWNEADQKSQMHDQMMFEAVRRALMRSVTAETSRTAELQGFLGAGSEWTAADHRAGAR